MEGRPRDTPWHLLFFKLGRKSRIRAGWFLRRLRERPRASWLFLRLHTANVFEVLIHSVGRVFDFVNNHQLRFLLGCKLQYDDDHPVLWGRGFKELESDRKLFPAHLPSIFHGVKVGAASLWSLKQTLASPKQVNPRNGLPVPQLYIQSKVLSTWHFTASNEPALKGWEDKSLKFYLPPHGSSLPRQVYFYKLKTFWFIFEKKSRIYNSPCATQLVDTGCNKQNLKIKLKLLHEKVAIFK